MVDLLKKIKTKHDSFGYTLNKKKKTCVIQCLNCKIV